MWIVKQQNVITTTHANVMQERLMFPVMTLAKQMKHYVQHLNMVNKVKRGLGFIALFSLFLTRTCRGMYNDYICLRKRMGDYGTQS